ncbi:hypothetical protein FV222_23810, partial [Methylobacterium sp. WL103]
GLSALDRRRRRGPEREREQGQGEVGDGEVGDGEVGGGEAGNGEARMRASDRSGRDRNSEHAGLEDVGHVVQRSSAPVRGQAGARTRGVAPSGIAAGVVLRLEVLQHGDHRAAELRVADGLEQPQQFGRVRIGGLDAGARAEEERRVDAKQFRDLAQQDLRPFGSIRSVVPAVLHGGLLTPRSRYAT